MKEIWKDIPGYEGSYQVSNLGKVKSLKFGKERILKTFNCKAYLVTNLCKDNKYKGIYIHQLVAMAFLGHIPNGHETVVNHIDNNPLNNNVDNLEIVTQRYNASCHKIDAGISWDKLNNKWLSRIHINKLINLGRFTNKQEAIDIYQKALNNIHLYNGDPKEFRNKLKEI